MNAQHGLEKLEATHIWCICAVFHSLATRNTAEDYAQFTLHHLDPI